MAKMPGGSNSDNATSINQTADSGYIVAGYSNSNDGELSGHHGSLSYSDYWIVKLSKEGTAVFTSEPTSAVKAKDINKDFTVYPNPAKDILYVQTNGNSAFSLINSSGKDVLTKTINGSGSINVSALPAGNYFLNNNATGVVQKVIIEK